VWLGGASAGTILAEYLVKLEGFKKNSRLQKRHGEGFKKNPGFFLMP
jgi:hypothetical protein